MSKFFVIEGPLRGKTFEVSELASIGRGENCAVRLDGRHVSRIHARMEKRPDGMLIKDNGSRNGIFVNGQSVREAILRPDDQLEVGEHVLVFDPTKDPEKLPRAAAIDSVADPFAPGEPDERLQKLLGVAAGMIALDDEKEIARNLLEALMLAISAERGFVMVTDGSGSLKPAARRAPSGDEEFYLSNVLHHQVSKERRAVIATDVIRRQPNEGKGIGILCAPLATKSGYLGLVYLDARIPEGDARPRFKSSDLRFASALAIFAATRLAQLRRISSGSWGSAKSLEELVPAFEKEVIVEALHGSQGDLSAAAKKLGIERVALDARLKALSLGAPVPPPAPPGSAEWKSVQV
ncbi:MAG TPA: FHA domain-containing protein [Planctomycetota bacterium]|nr:FHA domain-containing protein [Planctomycetota bacterium]